MATTDRRGTTPRGRLVIRLAILLLVAGLGGIAHGLLGVGDESEPGASSSSTPDGPSSAPSSASSQDAEPSTGPDSDPDSGSDSGSDSGDGPADGEDKSDQDRTDGAVPDGGVPSGVTGGLGDDVGLYSLDVLRGRVASDADLSGLTVPAADRGDLLAWAHAHGMAVLAPPTPARDVILWRTTKFTVLASGNEYGTRSLATDRGLEARRIVWVTLRHAASGTPVSYIQASLETGDGEAARAANSAYVQRVQALRERLSRTSTVIVGTATGSRQGIAVPEGNIHQGIVLAVRDRDAVRGGVLARVSLQAPGAAR